MQLLDRLSTKLTVTLLGLLLVLGFGYMLVSGWTMERHIHQVHQQLHQKLATNLVKENVIFEDGKISTQGLEQIFRTLMVVNPNIEVYLLDPTGQILSYSAPYRKVKREFVDVQPIRSFIDGNNHFPLWGDNPRSQAGRKVFSAAPVESDGLLNGYLYVVLGSDQFDSASATVMEDTVWRISGAALFALIGFALIAGGLIFRGLTARLRNLDRQVLLFEESCTRRAVPEIVPMPDEVRGSGDELDRLQASVARMTLKITQQMETIRRTDIMRRQLVANVSHDLRTPLAALDGYLQTLLLKRESLSPEQTREYVEIAAKSGQRLARLVDELFELSCLEAADRKPEPEAFCLAELASDVLQKFQLQARRRGLELELLTDPLASHAFAEIGLIERVLENLIANALAHTPDGGHIQVSLTPDEKNRVQVTVHDSGSGIARRELPYIFDRFYKPDNASPTKGKGAGLGLAIVKRILDLHKSRIVARSELGEGSSFVFWLPSMPAPG